MNACYLSSSSDKTPSGVPGGLGGGIFGNEVRGSEYPTGEPPSALFSYNIILRVSSKIFASGNSIFVCFRSVA